MRKLFNKAVALSMAAVMTIGVAGIVSAADTARVADGTNVATGAWESFSICTREDGGTWEDALLALRTEDFPEGQVKGKDYATEGSITSKTVGTATTGSAFIFNVVNSGWDGQYNSVTGELQGDNPWGMTASMTKLTLEAGRSYTLTFDVMGNLIAGLQTIKHIQVKVHQVGFGDAAFEMTDVTNCTTDGMIELKNGDAWKTVTAKFTVPDDFKGEAGVKFALGAFLKTYPGEIAMTGQIGVSNFKITADHQHTVNFVSAGKTISTEYVNNNGTVEAPTAPTRKGYTFDGWMVNGQAYTAATPITSDVTVTAKWTKTTKPARAKIKKLKSKKSKQLTVTLKKTKKAVGYQIQYSTSKKFKKAKTKESKKVNYTIKKLKSGVKYYVRVKAYKLDSAGNKVLSKKWSKVKSAYVN